MGMNVECAYCEELHSGKQFWNDKLNDYVCHECKEYLESVERK